MLATLHIIIKWQFYVCKYNNISMPLFGAGNNDNVCMYIIIT